MRLSVSSNPNKAIGPLINPGIFSTECNFFQMKYAKRAASAALLFSSGFSFLFAFLLKRKEKEGRYLFPYSSFRVSSLPLGNMTTLLLGSSPSLRVAT